MIKYLFYSQKDVFELCFCLRNSPPIETKKIVKQSKPNN